MKKIFLSCGILTGFLMCSHARGDDGVLSKEQLALTGGGRPPGPGEEVPLVGIFEAPAPPSPLEVPRNERELADWVRYLFTDEKPPGRSRDALHELDQAPPPPVPGFSGPGAIQSTDNGAAGAEEVPEVGDLGGPVEEIL